MITTEYVISGRVEGGGLKWGWTYFEYAVTSGPARPFEFVATAARSTGALPAPAVVGRQAAVTRGSALVALAPRGDTAIGLWEQWNTMAPVAAEVLIGPYLLTGSVLSPDGSATSPILGASFPVRDATLRRIDGYGDGAPIELARATIDARFVHMVSATR